jgi:hypothetical protein
MKWKLEMDPRNPAACRVLVDGQPIPHVIAVSHGIEIKPVMVFNENDPNDARASDEPMSFLRLEIIVPDLEVEYKQMGDVARRKFVCLPEIES